jgi:hypothetical protein
MGVLKCVEVCLLMSVVVSVVVNGRAVKKVVNV